MVQKFENPSIAAVFATMNRAATAVACVRALAAQTRPPERVVVADNVSSDNTLAALAALADLPFELIVHRMRENRGNAGGVEEAMELAFARGADAVWILDDDSWPRPGALAAMLAGGWDPEVVLHPLQEDPATGRFTWPLQVVEADGSVRLVEVATVLPARARVSSRGVWTGALVSRRIREVVGPVNGELFIRGEDEEYPWRIERAGFRTEAVTAAVMDHPGPREVVCWRLLGKRLFFERGLVDWKLYYKVRNMVWLKRRQAGARGAVLMALAYVLAVVRFDGPGRLPLLWEAVRDGWRGRLGKRA
jgi:glycosyltransferase involved in cell wall biosynthesis